uniref:Uncharacterized protein n=1 Tax=Palpitomonas bilix TaxID=652834 RepID=A0A7S3GHX4_9EUKA
MIIHTVWRGITHYFPLTFVQYEPSQTEVGMSWIPLALRGSLYLLAPVLMLSFYFDGTLFSYHPVLMVCACAGLIPLSTDLQIHKASLLPASIRGGSLLRWGHSLTTATAVSCCELCGWRSYHLLAIGYRVLLYPLSLSI